MRRLWVWIAGLLAAGAVATPLALTQGDGSIDVFVGSTPVPESSGLPACTHTANTSNFVSVFNLRSGSHVLCLESGDYGDFNRAAGLIPDKTVPGVTIRPADGATISFDSVEFGTGDDWVFIKGTRESLTIHDIDLGGTTNNTIIQGFTSPGNTAIGPASMNNSNNLIDDGLFTLEDCPDGSCLVGEGRITISGGSATNPAGVTISNSTFVGNGTCGDGIQITAGTSAARGVTVGPGNEFDTMDHELCISENDVWRNNPDCFPEDNASCPAPHTDSMQVVQGCCFTFTGNFIHDSSFGLVGFADEVHTVTVTNNVMVDIGPTAYCLAGGSGDVVQHNTFANEANIFLCVDGDGNPETDVEWSDNIQWQNPNIQGSSSYASGFPHHNMCLSVAAGGENDTCAGTGSLSNQTPSWAGGTPSSWDEWADAALNGGSAGKNAASDGEDMGIDADLLD